MAVVDAGCTGIIKYASFTKQTFFIDGALQKKPMEDLRNAPKGLTFEFQPDSSQKKATSWTFSANQDDPLGGRTG